MSKNKEEQEHNTGGRFCCVHTQTQQNRPPCVCLNNGGMQGYLLRCLVCGKYRLHIDFDLNLGKVRKMNE